MNIRSRIFIISAIILFFGVFGLVNHSLAAILFQENFDEAPIGWNNSQSQFGVFTCTPSAGGPNTVGGVTHYGSEITTSGRGGTGKSWKFWRGNGLNSGANDSGLMNRWLTTGEFTNQYTDIYSRWYFRIDPNFYWTGGPGAIKWMARGQYEQTALANCGLSSNGYWLDITQGTDIYDGKFKLFMYGPGINDNWYSNETLRSVGVTDGSTWHSFEIRFKINTSGVADGMLQMWVDGTKLTLERPYDQTHTHPENINFGFPSGYYHTVPIAPGVANTGGSGTFAHKNGANWASMEIDDWVVSTTYIGLDNAPDITPPAAPTGLTIN